jgi:hypothetical protein
MARNSRSDFSVRNLSDDFSARDLSDVYEDSLDDDILKDTAKAATAATSYAKQAQASVVDAETLKAAMAAATQPATSAKQAAPTAIPSAKTMMGTVIDQSVAAMNPVLAAMPPKVRATYTYLARLASSMTSGQAPQTRPIPAAQRARGVALVVQILPDGTRVIFR